MRAKKILQVVVYDIENDRTRNKLSKLLEKYGKRVNFSVFECMFSPVQMEKVKDAVGKMLNPKTDSVVFYTVCVHCYVKTVYMPARKSKPEIVTSL
ncbi:MAG: CRISPR-associated endonuclease Cas2 [Bacteroidales bacterium]|nr:CRISPR-associated endonuclease Cas2 [Bacteroidales bacterium]